MIDLLYLAGFTVASCYVVMWIELTHIWYDYFKRKA